MEKTVSAALLNLQALKSREHDLVDPVGSLNEARDKLLTALAEESIERSNGGVAKMELGAENPLAGAVVLKAADFPEGTPLPSGNDVPVNAAPAVDQTDPATANAGI